mmetsp:Transcript_23733/g.47154  ORF Transcript_23733/g.47154 Transcript_23733/m.47154 type:complete len:398 (+) Transcript_23733:163-1356(+)
MGTKKQKMEISKAIAETIYSKVPPGRFLKKCSDGSGLWKELSKREAEDKAAQAMAYIINAESLKLKRRERRRSLSLPLTQQPRQQDDVAASSTQTADQSQLKPYATNNHLNDNDSSSVAARRLAAGGERVDSNKALSAASAAAADDELLPANSIFQQQLHQLQRQSSATTNPPPISAGINLLNNRDGSVQVQSQISQMQYHHQQRHQQYQQQLLLQNAAALGNHHTTVELTLLLNQAQQQNQQQLQLQQLLSQHGTSQHIMQPHPLTSLSAYLPPTLSLSTPSLSTPTLSVSNGRYLTGSQPATNNLLQNMHSRWGNLHTQSNVGATTAPQALLQTQTQLMNPGLLNPSTSHLQQQLQQQYPRPSTAQQHNSQDPQTNNEPSQADRWMLHHHHRRRL